MALLYAVALALVVGATVVVYRGMTDLGTDKLRRARLIEGEPRSSSSDGGAFSDGSVTYRADPTSDGVLLTPEYHGGISNPRPPRHSIFGPHGEYTSFYLAGVMAVAGFVVALVARLHLPPVRAR